MRKEAGKEGIREDPGRSVEAGGRRNSPKKVIAILGKISGKHFPGADTEKMGPGRVGDSCLHSSMGPQGKRGKITTLGIWSLAVGDTARLPASLRSITYSVLAFCTAAFRNSPRNQADPCQGNLGDTNQEIHPERVNFRA